MVPVIIVGMNDLLHDCPDLLGMRLGLGAVVSPGHNAYHSTLLAGVPTQSKNNIDRRNSIKTKNNQRKMEKVHVQKYNRNTHLINFCCGIVYYIDSN